MSNFFNEMKRRNVFRVGIAYGVVSWIIVQVIDTISGPLDLPVWTPTLVIVLLLIGLPIALLFAWAFELTPEGVRRSTDVEITESVTSSTARKLNAGIIALLLVAVLVMVWERQSLVDQIDSGIVNTRQLVPGQIVTSIAVLPFVSMAADSEQEFFSDGISEELLNVLAKIPEFRVAARTSSFQFKGENLDITKIAEQLNVAHVLEGSVRRSGDQIRITAQLIEASSGFHLWSDTYDRAFVDVFKIQDEISAAIVDELSTNLGISSIARPQQSQKINPDAFAALMQGQELIRKRTAADIEQSIRYFRHSLAIDPEYAPAYAQLGLAWYLLSTGRTTYGDLSRDISVPQAREAVNKALALNPQLPEALGIAGLLDHAEEKTATAIEKFERALAINPSLTEVRNWYSSALDDVGKEEEATNQLRLAYELDPLSRLTLSNYASRLIRRGQYDQAQRLIERMETIDPSEAFSLQSRISSDEGRLSDAALQQLEALELSPAERRRNVGFFFALVSLGLMEDAENIWPGENGSGFMLRVIGESERALEIELARQQSVPDTRQVDDRLHYAYWANGDLDDAARYAELAVDGVSEPIRFRRFEMAVLATKALVDGKQAEALSIFAALEAQLDQNMKNVGTSGGREQWLKGLLTAARGDRSSAIQILIESLQKDHTWDSWKNNILYRHLALDQSEPLNAQIKETVQHQQAERHKFLQVVCGGKIYTSWSPSADACRTINL